MKCPYCGHDNPDGAVYCVCGRTLTLGTPYGVQTDFAVQKSVRGRGTRRVNIVPIILVLLLVLGAGGFLYVQKYTQDTMTEQSKWHRVSGVGYSIKVPKELKKEEMLTVNAGETGLRLLDFYTSENAGFNVSVYRYSDAEKESFGRLDAEGYLNDMIAKGKTVKINGQELKYQVREGKNYIYAGIKRHGANYIGKSDDLYYIEAIFPCSDCYYQVDVYCAEDDKSEYEESLLKWLDSFTIE